MGGTYRNNDGVIENLSGGNIVDAALDKTSDHAISNAATATKFEEIDEVIGDTDISGIGDGSVTGGISQLNSDLSTLHFEVKVYTVTTDENGLVSLSIPLNRVFITANLPHESYYIDNHNLNVSGSTISVRVTNWRGDPIKNATVDIYAYYINGNSVIILS